MDPSRLNVPQGIGALHLASACAPQKARLRGKPQSSAYCQTVINLFALTHCWYSQLWLWQLWPQPTATKQAAGQCRGHHMHACANCKPRRYATVIVPGAYLEPLFAVLVPKVEGAIRAGRHECAMPEQGHMTCVEHISGCSPTFQHPPVAQAGLEKARDGTQATQTEPA